jgi:hypothetical protein
LKNIVVHPPTILLIHSGSFHVSAWKLHGIPTKHNFVGWKNEPLIFHHYRINKTLVATLSNDLLFAVESNSVGA